MDAPQALSQVQQLAKNVAVLLDSTPLDAARLQKMRETLANIKTMQDYMRATTGALCTETEAFALLAELSLVEKK